MGNNAAAAKARRKLEKSGGKNLPALCIHDYEGWSEVLRDAGYLSQSQDMDTDRVRRATEDWIKDLCRAHWRQVADAQIHVRTGILAREEPPPEERSIRFDPGGRHWSFKPGDSKDKGRTLSKAERDEFLTRREDLRRIRVEGALARFRSPEPGSREYLEQHDEGEAPDRDVTEAQCQGLGMRITGSG